MRYTASLSSLLLVSVAYFGHAEERLTEHHLDRNEAVTLTASGGVRPNLMRKHAREDDESESLVDLRRQHMGDTMAMFAAMDINKDGLVSSREIKDSMQDLLGDLDVDGDGAISRAEFRALATHADDDTEHVHNHRHTHHRERQAGAAAIELERIDGDTDGDGVDNRISCGAHKALSCELCPTTDDTGSIVFDHGHDWCNGDCVYHDNECKASGTVQVDGTEIAAGAHSTSAAPDLFNADITPEDKKVVNRAAQEAVAEQQKEKDQLKTGDPQEEAASRDRAKIWLYVVITFSGILGVCALASCVALIVFIFMPKPDLPGTKEESWAEDDGEEAEADM